MATIATIQHGFEVIDSTFNFDIRKLPLTGPGGAPTPHFGLFKCDDEIGQCLPIAVKAGYVPHTREDIRALFEAAVTTWDCDDIDVQCHWSDRGHELIVAPSREFRRSIYGTKDNIFPRMKLGGYFGRTFVCETGFYRDACKNLARVSAVKSSIVEIRHTNGLRAKMNDLIATMSRSAKSWDAIVGVAETLESQRVQIVDFMAQLYPIGDDASGKATTQHKNRTEAILQRLIRENAETDRPAITDGRASLWQLVQAVTGYVQHDKTRHKLANGEQMGTLERALVGINDIESENAWELALSMAN